MEILLHYGSTVFETMVEVLEEALVHVQMLEMVYVQVQPEPVELKMVEEQLEVLKASVL